MPIYISNKFPKIAFDYNKESDPFFEAIVTENLVKLNALKIGEKILKEVDQAEPQFRNKFPKNINVIIQPPISRDWVAPGMDKFGNLIDKSAYDNFMNPIGERIGSLMPTREAKTMAQALSESNARGGNGSVCWLFFSNNEVMLNFGGWCPPFITMGHELIHCVHALYGKMKTDYQEEEWATVGIKGFENEELTENKLRKEVNLPPREKYYMGD